MKEPTKAIISAVERSANQGGDMGRSEKTVSSDLADDRYIIRSHAKRRRLSRTAEARPTRWS
jgi:hypothetical protein